MSVYMSSVTQARAFNQTYSGDYLSRVASPIVGVGAGMICLEGTGEIALNDENIPLDLNI